MDVATVVVLVIVAAAVEDIKLICSTNCGSRCVYRNGQFGVVCFVRLPFLVCEIKHRSCCWDRKRCLGTGWV